jgi:urease accessory protein
MTQLYRFLHLADSALPVGSFAYSYGLESTIDSGLIKNKSDLKNYIYSFLQQSVSMEIPYINSCYQLENPLEESVIDHIVASYSAMVLVPSIYKSSITSGKIWLRLLDTFYPDAKLEVVRNYFLARELPFHYVIILALCLKKVEFSLNEIRTLFLHSVLRDQISAAIRLGNIGSIEGNMLQHEFYDFFSDLLLAVSEMNFSNATRSTFLLELNQANHKHMYSKLFQN